MEPPANCQNSGDRGSILFSRARDWLDATGSPRYPLYFPEVSTALLHTKTFVQADINFGQAPCHPLSPKSLARIAALQKQLRLGAQRPTRRLLTNLKQMSRHS